MATNLAIQSFVALRVLTAVAFSLLVLVGCGGGGGGGGGSSDIEVLDEATLLLSDGGPEPRTGQKVEFVLRNLTDPGIPLTEEDIEVFLDGELDTESRVRVNPPDVEKRDVTLVLDVSSSLTPADLEKVKNSAQAFANEILDLVSSFRIYYFSSPSGTALLGEYRAVDDGFGNLVWMPDPAPDIASISGGVSQPGSASPRIADKITIMPSPPPRPRYSSDADVCARRRVLIEL